MRFDERDPIYAQIADYVCARVASGEWQPGTRVPSVRDLAAELEVNPNTVMRALSLLQERDVISPRRGVGFFVAPRAVRRVLEMRRREFFARKLPALLREMRALGITADDIKKRQGKK